MIVFPNAKINLGLNITGVRPDGYHDIETLFYPIPLEDVLEVVPASFDDKEYEFTCTGMPSNFPAEDNLAVKAYLLLKKDYDMPPVRINLHKQIPAGSGLGGGSSDAAFMLKLLNDLFHLGIPVPRLEEYASMLGSDCAFFIRNQPVFAGGIGDRFTPTSLSLRGYIIAIVKPEISVSTREAFKLITTCRPTNSVREAVLRPVAEWKGRLVNDFEDVIFTAHPEIEKLKRQLYRAGALYASLSGSGSSVYGLFRRHVMPHSDRFPGLFFQTFIL